MSKLKALFLCTGNSCRSQIAEGWAKHLKSDLIDAYSAGVEVHGMNALAVQVMAEAGVRRQAIFASVIKSSIRRWCRNKSLLNLFT